VRLERVGNAERLFEPDVVALLRLVPLNAPLGPLAGAVNVTGVLGTGLPPESRTVRWIR